MHAIFKIQTKAVYGWNRTNLLNVCHRMFLSIAQIGACFQGPVHS